MLDLIKQSLTRQFEAGLCMLDDCLRLCPAEHWDGLVAKYPFWQVGYHVLCFVDLYLTRDEKSFVCRPELQPLGLREFDDEHPSRNFGREELRGYVSICRQKAIDTIGAETAETLAGPSGFPWLKFPRAEAYLYNLRHIQHHTGQLGAYVRRVDSPLDPRWIGTGWR